MPNFRFLTGDINYLSYGGKWISSKQNNGEFDYWFIIELINWEDATGENSQGTYNVSLCSVSPSEAGKENLESAFQCCGIEAANKELRNDSIRQVECLNDYGVKAVLWNRSGNNARKLLRQAKHQAKLASSLYGLYMDKTENRIGSTGWEMQRGDLNSAIDRAIGPEADLVRKISGR